MPIKKEKKKTTLEIKKLMENQHFYPAIRTNNKEICS
jgi:hypothetical protein